MFNLVQSSGGFSAGALINWLGAQVTSFVNRQVDQKLNQAGAAWRARSRSLAPVKTGDLVSKEDYQVANHTLILIMGSEHDIFVEFGTRHMRPQPHVRVALLDMNKVFGTTVELEFNRPGGSTWTGIHAHQGGFILPHNLTAKQRAHVATHLLPVSRRLHRGMVKRAKMRVRRFG